MKRKLLISVLAAATFAFTATSASALDVPRVGESDEVFVFPPDIGVVESVDLAGGMQLKRTVADAIILAPVGSQLLIVQTSNGPGLAVEAPDPDSAPTPGWSPELAGDVLDRVVAGASFASIEREFPPFATAAPDDTDTWKWQNETCLAATNKYQYLRSCTNSAVIERNSVSKFIASTSDTRAQIHNSASAEVKLTKIEGISHIGIDEEIRKFEPYVTRNSTSCSAVMTLSLTYNGTGISHSQSVCPEKLDPYLQPGGAKNGLTTTWTGSQSGSAVSAQTEVTRAPVDTGSHRWYTGTSRAKLPRVCGGGFGGLICNILG